MIISRSFKIHVCVACSTPLNDEDFIRMGISIFQNNCFFFDYVCRKCEHRGRYVVIDQPKMNAIEALAALARHVSLEDENAPKDQIDWDRLRG